MKITHNKVGQNLSVRDVPGKGSEKAGAAGDVKSGEIAEAKATKAGGASEGARALKDNAGLGASKVEISSRGMDIRKAKEIANAVPDIDEAKVARLQKLIDDGEYKVDSDAVAGKMLDEQMKWE